MKIVVATFNPGKLRELEALLALPGVTLVSLAAFAGATAPEEHGATLEANALLKAHAAHTITGLAAIADDTGLEVDALDGAPGIHSARFAGEGADDAARVRLLLERLAGVAPVRRTARFRTVCVAVLGDGKVLTAEGVLEGAITLAPRGTQGFGYDPVFEVEGRGLTLAELSPAGKNEVSHRARAVRALARELAVLTARS